MKLSIMSDLHLEFDRGDLFVPEYYGEDVLILAGDIQMGLVHTHWFAELLNQRDVIYILGNHEFYRQNFDTMYREVWDWVQSVNKLAKSRGYEHELTFLDDDCIYYKDVLFIGSTLWTDFDSGNELVMNHAPKYMSDYQVITKGKYNCDITPEQILKEHRASRNFIESELTYKGKKVVITHHLPSEKSIDLKYIHEKIGNHYFFSHLDSLVEKADLWIHGHTHCSHDYKIGDCRVICNPRGYRDENVNFKLVLVEI